MNKKGFTLIEIIISITLIILVGTVAVILLNKNNDIDKEKEKIISNVISASDVYFSMNEELQTKLKDNYGYLVITIDELKEMGLLSEDVIIPEATEEEIKNGYDYNKIVIIDRDYDNEYRNLSRDSLGYIDYQYPYKKNEPFILNIPTLYIENFEKEYFKCSSGLEDGISYVDEDYNVVTTDNYSCEPNLSGNRDITADESGLEYTIISYTIHSIERELKGDRYIYIYNLPVFELKKVGNSSNIEYDCGNWTNEDVKLSIEDKNNDNRPASSERLKYEFTPLIESPETKSNINKNYNIYKCSDDAISCEIEAEAIYSLNGILSSENEYTNKNDPFKCMIKIDKNLPIITQDYGSSSIRINDDESGLKSYYISDNACKYDVNNKIPEDIKLKLSNLSNNEIIQEITDSEHCVYAIDNAGNEKIYEYIPTSSMYPTIEITPMENSFTKFKVTLRDKEGIEEILTQYTFSDKAMDTASKNTGGYQWRADDFIEDWDYDSNYLQKNYNTIGKIDSMYSSYDSDGKVAKKEWDCNDAKTECSYTFNMYDQVQRCYYSKTNWGCSYYIDEKYLFNLQLLYYIKAINTRGKIREFTIDSNMEFFINNFTNGIWTNYSDNENYVYFKGINEYGDIALLASNGSSRKVYFYDNNRNEIIDFYEEYDIKYKDHFSFNLLTMNNRYFKFNFSYSSDDEGYTHLYDKKTQLFNEGDSYPKKQVKTKTNFISQYNNYATTEQQNFIHSYLEMVEDFEKIQVNSPVEYDVYNNKSDCYIQDDAGNEDEFRCFYFLFNNMYENKNYNSVIIYRKAAYWGYDKLFFLQTPTAVLKKSEFIN